MRRILTLVSVYIIVGLLVYGFTYNHFEKCWTGYNENKWGDWCWSEEAYDNARFNNSIGAGMFWLPLGVIFGTALGVKAILDGAIYITRWP